MKATEAQKESFRRYGKENRERLTAKKREWALANPELAKQRRHETYLRRREKHLAQCKAYREKNRDAINAYQRKAWKENYDPVKESLRKKAYREAHPDLVRERSRKYQARVWAEKHEERLEYHRNWRKNNRKKCREANRRFEKNNPERVKEIRKKSYEKNKQTLFAKTYRRRAKKKGCYTDETAASFYAFVRSKKSIPCYYCGVKIAGKDAHIDHIIAIAKKGNHSSENLAASCEECNLRKGDRLPAELPFLQQPVFNI